MSDHHATPTHPVARKEHRCIYCGGPILVGEQYTQQTGFYESCPYRNRYHAECYESCADECNYYGEWEFLPYNADYPERVKLIVAARRSEERIQTSDTEKPTEVGFSSEHQRLTQPECSQPRR